MNGLLLRPFQLPFTIKIGEKSKINPYFHQNQHLKTIFTSKFACLSSISTEKPRDCIEAFSKDLAVQWRCAREEPLVVVPISGLFWHIPEAPSVAENFGCIGPRGLGLIRFGDLEFGNLLCNLGLRILGYLVRKWVY
ncbi:Protein three rows [Gossypium arboreum]|uniref:Protein three rows n=1 Tax=Gossypium arboreum TaxID=29729 RepID=A0A0B0MV51_GOSAR|nr:Protein three rows [Gossypium arboreum]